MNDIADEPGLKTMLLKNGHANNALHNSTTGVLLLIPRI
jgi:hypothetical protein